MEYCIKGGTLVDPVSNREGQFDLVINEGRVTRIQPEISDASGKIINADGLHIFPGLVDLHVHLREPGREDKETIGSGTEAAVAGGFTSIAAMPNTDPPIDNAYSIAYVLHRAAQDGLCKVLPIGCLTKEQKGEELAELGEMVKAGAIAFSNDGIPLMDGEVMRVAMDYSRLFKRPIMIHAEDRNLVAGGQMHLGEWSMILGLKGIPTVSEEVIVARDILLAESTGASIHFCHLSSGKSVDLVRRAKQRGVSVTAEVTPHHLALTDACVAGFNTNTKVNPPLVSEFHRKQLIAGLVDGTIDAIATDHAPHTLEEKHQEYNHAPFGLIGLETALAVILTKLYHSGQITLRRIVESMSTEPARILGVNSGLQEGAPADLVLVDLNHEWIYSEDAIRSRSKNSPFIGEKFRGRAVMTMVNGDIKFQLKG